MVLHYRVLSTPARADPSSLLSTNLQRFFLHCGGHFAAAETARRAVMSVCRLWRAGADMGVCDGEAENPKSPPPPPPKKIGCLQLLNVGIKSFRTVLCELMHLVLNMTSSGDIGSV